MLLSKFEAENPFFKRYYCILFLCMCVCLILLKRVVRRVEKINKALGQDKAVL